MTCPICNKPSDAKYIPFCSKHCEQVDLGKWLTGHYAIPAVEMDDVNEPALPDEDDHA